MLLAHMSLNLNKVRPGMLGRGGIFFICLLLTSSLTCFLSSITLVARTIILRPSFLLRACIERTLSAFSPTACFPAFAFPLSWLSAQAGRFIMRKDKIDKLYGNVPMVVLSFSEHAINCFGSTLAAAARLVINTEIAVTTSIRMAPDLSVDAAFKSLIRGGIPRAQAELLVKIAKCDNATWCAWLTGNYCARDLAPRLENVTPS